MKKAISILLALILMVTVFTAVQFTAGAAEDAESESVGVSSGTTGDCTWRLDGSGTLTISGSGAMEDYGNKLSNDRSYYVTDAPWGDVVNKLVINNGVTYIGICAFEGCKSLSSISISDSVTGIGWDAFYNTRWYDNQANGLVYAGKVAYDYIGTMPSGTSIALRDGTKGIADDAFYKCTGLTSIMIPNGVVGIGEEAFYGCTGLTSISIPNSVKTIGVNAFFNCKNLTKATIGSGVTTIGNSAFWCCSGLTSVTIPGSVKSIDNYAFAGCNSLTSINLSEGLKSIGYYALCCQNVKSITVPESVTTIEYSALGYYFPNANRSPETVKISGFTIYGKLGSRAEKYAKENGFAVIDKSKIPAAPTVSVANGTNGLDVSWSKVTNAQSYVFYYKTATGNWSSTATTSTKMTLKNIESGKMYYFQVQSIGSGGMKGNYSKVASMTYLSRATIASVTYNGNNTIKINPVAGAKKYVVYFKKSTDKNWSSATTTNLYYPILNIKKGSLYYVQVRAVGSTVNGPYSSVKSLTYK